MFTHFEDKIIIANIASPNSIQNIEFNNKVCVSFVDVFIQKGFKIKGKATIIYKNDSIFSLKVQPLTNLYSDKFPISAIIEIEVEKVEIIRAPSYFLYPEITEKQQIESALETYKIVKK